MHEWVCINGELVPADQAHVSVFDSGFTQGIGLFETMRAKKGRVFRLDDHLQRLIRSAATLGWALLPSMEELRLHVTRVAHHCGHDEARVRLTVTTGSVRITAEDTPPRLTLVATAGPGGAYPAQLYSQGVTALISPFRQSQHDPTVGHKTTSYFSRLAALRTAHATGAMEAIWFTEQGQLAEGCISNVFLVRDERLLTPPLNTPVLPGIARATVLSLAAELSIDCEERPLSREELVSADEVFLTNCMMDVMPVVRIEREPVGAERPGETTLRILRAYRDRVDEECADEVS